MADYYPLISRAVAGLERNNGANRCALYERARSTLIAGLRAIAPTLSEFDITRERLALEEAIARVESERDLAIASQRLPRAEARPPAARAWRPNLASLPWLRGPRQSWNLNNVRLALTRAAHPIVLLSWYLSLCLFLNQGWFWPKAWEGKIALALALLCGLVWLADRLHPRFGPRLRLPVALRYRAGEPADTLQPGSERPHVALANRRATALLLENLSNEQRRQYTKHRHFDVVGGESGKRYRIWHRASMNIQELDALGQPKWIWCFYPAGVVICDVLLAQKMALELFETDAIRIANRFSVEPYGASLTAASQRRALIH